MNCGIATACAAEPRERGFNANASVFSEADALLVGWGGVVVPACLGDEFAPALGCMLFMDE